MPVMARLVTDRKADSVQKGMDIPNLEGHAKAAVEHRDGHLQIIASAGSGKTEVVSQRVSALLADGFPPESIVAFTFTERAASSLKSRIERCVVVHPSLGPPFLDIRRLPPLRRGVNLPLPHSTSSASTRSSNPSSASPGSAHEAPGPMQP